MPSPWARAALKLRVRVADIFKGASNTVLMSEKQLNTAMLGSSHDDDASCYRAGWNGDYDHYRRTRRVSGVWTTPQPDFANTTTGLRAVAEPRPPMLAWQPRPSRCGHQRTGTTPSLRAETARITWQTSARTPTKPCHSN